MEKIPNSRSLRGRTEAGMVWTGKDGQNRGKDGKDSGKDWGKDGEIRGKVVFDVRGTP